MPWLSATTVVDRNLAEALSDALLGAGALSVDVSDADAGTPDERPIFDEPGGAPAPGWSRARVAALFPSDADVADALLVAFNESGVSEGTAYDLAPVEDDDWVRRTQSQFEPQKVAADLWIVPTWHAPPILVRRTSCSTRASLSVRAPMRRHGCACVGSRRR